MTLPSVPWRLVLPGLALEAGCLGLWRLGRLPGGPASQVLPFLAVMAVMTAAWALAAWRVAASAAARGETSAILVLSVAFWVTLLPGGPLLDNDLHRYLWEGKVILAGESPYLHAPGDPSLETYRDEGWERVGYAGLPSPYGPSAQYLFALMRAAGGGSLVVAKAVLGAWFALTVWLSMRLLGLFGADRRLVLLWAWHPAALKEFADSGHLEPFVIALVLGAVLLLLRGREAWAGVLLAAGACAKFFPLLLLPAFLARSRRRPVLLAAFSGTALVLYLPFLGAGTEVLGSLRTYLGWWTFNHGPFGILRGAMGLAVAEPERAARAIVWLGAGAASVIVGLRSRRDLAETFTRRLGLLLFGVAVCSPAVMPWYLLWGLPLLLARPVWSAFGFAIAAQSSYLYYLGNRDVQGVRLAEYLLLAAALAWEWRRERRGRCARAGTPPPRLPPPGGGVAACVGEGGA